MKMLKLKQISYACPSQWEGKTDDHRAVYIRYRYGYLTVEVSAPFGTVDDAIQSDDFVYEKQIGDELDGFMGLMSTSEMIAYTRDVLNWEEVHND